MSCALQQFRRRGSKRCRLRQERDRLTRLPCRNQDTATRAPPQPGRTGTTPRHRPASTRTGRPAPATRAASPPSCTREHQGPQRDASAPARTTAHPRRRPAGEDSSRPHCGGGFGSSAQVWSTTTRQMTLAPAVVPAHGRRSYGGLVRPPPRRSCSGCHWARAGPRRADRCPRRPERPRRWCPWGSHRQPGRRRRAAGYSSGRRCWRGARGAGSLFTRSFAAVKLQAAPVLSLVRL